MTGPRGRFSQRMGERLLEAPGRFAVTKLDASCPECSQVEDLEPALLPPTQLPVQAMLKAGIYPDHIAILEHFFKDIPTVPRNPDGNDPQQEHV